MWVHAVLPLDIINDIFEVTIFQCAVIAIIEYSSFNSNISIVPLIVKGDIAIVVDPRKVIEFHLGIEPLVEV